MNRPIPEAIPAACPENARRPSRRKVPPNGGLASLPPAFSSVAIRRPHLLHQSHPCKLPQVIADGPRSLAKLLADASHGLLAIHPQRSKDSHTNRTRHGPKSIGIGHGHCGIFGHPRFVRGHVSHCKGLLSTASHYIQIFCTKYLLLNGFATCVSPVTPRSIAAAKNVYSGTRNKPRGNLYAHDCQ